MRDEPLLLTRLDPTRNMARFYLLAMEQDLFNGIALVRNWGRIGTRGRLRIELFRSRQDAGVRLAAIANRKVKRGYQVAEGS